LTSVGAGTARRHLHAPRTPASATPGSAALVGAKPSHGFVNPVDLKHGKYEMLFITHNLNEVARRK